MGARPLARHDRVEWYDGRLDEVREGVVNQDPKGVAQDEMLMVWAIGDGDVFVRRDRLKRINTAVPSYYSPRTRIRDKAS